MSNVVERMRFRGIGDRAPISWKDDMLHGYIYMYIGIPYTLDFWSSFGLCVSIFFSLFPRSLEPCRVYVRTCTVIWLGIPRRGYAHSCGFTALLEAVSCCCCYPFWTIFSVCSEFVDGICSLFGIAKNFSYENPFAELWYPAIIY